MADMESIRNALRQMALYLVRRFREAFWRQQESLQSVSVPNSQVASLQSFSASTLVSAKQSLQSITINGRRSISHESTESYALSSDNTRFDVNTEFLDVSHTSTLYRVQSFFMYPKGIRVLDQYPDIRLQSSVDAEQFIGFRQLRKENVRAAHGKPQMVKPKIPREEGATPMEGPAVGEEFDATIVEEQPALTDSEASTVPTVVEDNFIRSDTEADESMSSLMKRLSITIANYESQSRIDHGVAELIRFFVGEVMKNVSTSDENFIREEGQRLVDMVAQCLNDEDRSTTKTDLDSRIDGETGSKNISESVVSGLKKLLDAVECPQQEGCEENGGWFAREVVARVVQDTVDVISEQGVTEAGQKLAGAEDEDSSHSFQANTIVENTQELVATVVNEKQPDGDGTSSSSMYKETESAAANENDIGAMDFNRGNDGI